MLGLKEVLRRRVQFSLIALVVTLVSYLVLMVNGLGVGLNQQAGSALRRLDADAIAYGDRANLSMLRSEMSAVTLEQVSALPGVDEAAPLGYFASNVATADGEIRSAAFLGFEAGSIAEPDVVDGNALAVGQQGGVVADREFLRQTGLDVGDIITVERRLESLEFTIVGVVDVGSFFFQPVIYLPLDEWRDLRYGDSQGEPATSVILLKGRGLSGTDGDGFEVVSKETAFANIEGVSGQQATVTALRVFGYLIGGIVVSVFFYVLTLQKEPQFGLLKALGASAPYLLRQLAVQALSIAAVGVAIAIPAAVLTAAAIERVPDPVPIAFTTQTYVVTALLLMLTGLVGSVASGWRVLRVDAMIALGHQA